MNVTPELESAYLATTYRIFWKQHVANLRIGEKATFIENLVNAGELNPFMGGAIITSANPYSQELSKKANRLRLEELELYLKSNGFLIAKALGVPDNQDSWEPEKSYFVLNISQAESTKIGLHFHQNAFVYINQSFEISLYYCNHKD